MNKTRALPLIVFSVLVLLFIWVSSVLPTIAEQQSSASGKLSPSEIKPVQPQSPLIGVTAPFVTPTGIEPSPQDPKGPDSYSVPKHVWGVYSTSWTAGISKIDSIINFIKENGLNTLVIDVKDDTGIISYPSTVALATQIGAGSKRIRDIRGLITRVKQAGIYPIARIVVFKDPLLAKSHPEMAVRDKNGGLWKDRKGMIWVDPNNREVWKYNVEVAKEAIGMGFSEIQYDYVRFLSDGKISNCIYPYSKGQPKEDVIRDFLLYSKKEINALNTPLSADIFGLVISVPDDLNLGQKLEKIAAAVDYISPMVYPSHYPTGSFEFKDPDSHPYEVIFKAFQIGNKRIQGSPAKFRPWLQDFNLKSSYGKEQLQAQIKALKDNGIHDWIFWNPSNKYDPAKYQNLK